MHRHQCLAGTNIALQKTMHGSGEFEICTNLTDRPLLSVGERERQPFDEAVGEFTGDLVGDTRRLPLDTALATNQFELHPQQFVEHEPPTSLAHLRHRLRLMDTEQRRRPVDEIEPVKHRLRHRIIKTPRAASVHRLLNKHDEITSQQARLLRLGVNRNDPTGLVADQIHNRAGHLPLAPIQLTLAVHHQGHAGCQLFLPPALVEEREPQLMPTVTDHDLGERAAPELPGPAGAHLADDRRLLAGLEIADRCLACGRDDVADSA